MLTVQNLGYVFDSRLERACVCCEIAYVIKQPNLNLKTLPKQVLGFLPFAFALPGLSQSSWELVEQMPRLAHSSSSFLAYPKQPITKSKKLLVNLDEGYTPCRSTVI